MVRLQTFCTQKAVKICNPDIFFPSTNFDNLHEWVFFVLVNVVGYPLETCLLFESFYSHLDFLLNGKSSWCCRRFRVSVVKFYYILLCRRESVQLWFFLLHFLTFTLNFVAHKNLVNHYFWFEASTFIIKIFSKNLSRRRSSSIVWFWKMCQK